MKGTDFVNITIQALMRVTPLGNYFLIPENYKHCKSALICFFGELTMKIWHARNFKGQVSPYAFLQVIDHDSGKRFRAEVQSDPVEFMLWLLKTLHTDLKCSSTKNSIIHQCFDGELEIVKEIHVKDGGQSKNIVAETSRMSFLMLELDLPPPPFFETRWRKALFLRFGPRIFCQVLFEVWFNALNAKK